MASRRLAISSLLCADDSEAAAAGHSPPGFVTHTSADGTTVQGLHASSPRFSPISSWANPSAEVVPTSVNYGAHSGRRTPSPSSFGSRPPSYPVIARRSSREIALDGYTKEMDDVTYHSTNDPAVESVDHSSRGRRSGSIHAVYPSQEDPGDYYTERRGIHRSAECSYSTILRRSVLSST